MNRLETLGSIDEVFFNDPLVVNCGATSRELASIRTAPNHLYMLDSMGLAAAVGLGLALASDRPVGAIEGDGSLLMGLSVLASIAFHRPQAFTLIVLDNHIHASAKSFPTQSAAVSITELCRGAGLETRFTSDLQELKSLLVTSRSSEDGPRVIVAEIEPQNAAGIPFLLTDPVVVKQGFEEFLKEES